MKRLASPPGERIAWMLSELPPTVAWAVPKVMLLGSMPAWLAKAMN